MKNRYQRMTKEERKKLRKDYKDSHAELKKRLDRVVIISIIGILYGIAMFIFDYYRNAVDIWSWIIDSVLVIVCVLLFVQSRRMLAREYNRFAIQLAHNQEEKKRVERKNNRRKK